MTRPRESQVAVIGWAFRFPGADGPDAFWRIIRDGTDHVTRFTEEELAAAGVPEAKYRAPDFVGASGVLEDIAGFDAEFFGISGREAEYTDPQHRMFLECAHHALEDSGYGREHGGLRVGVFASTGYHLYSMENYLLNNALQGTVEDDWVSRMQVMVGNYTDFTATRAAFRLGLTGPAVGVQTACSSSLAAVQLAAQSVLVDDCDIALAGATAVHVPQVLGYRYVKGSILSKSGHLRAFDAEADGTVGGTGVAAVVLKPLARAMADGDTIHGVIRGWGVTNDGADKTTYTAPSAAGQRRAVERALDRAGVRADSIGYLETHGTGTLKGDPIEFAGATAAFRRDTERTEYCALGSTKANIGHLDVCSGLASLIKALLVVKHGTIPPLANFSRPNPALDLAGSPFYIPRTARPWPAGDTPRRAGVTSLGVGGTNVHVIVEEPPAPAPRGPRRRPPGVLVLSGRTEAALAANARAFRDHLRRQPDTDMADLVASTAGRLHGRHRLAARGDTPAALADGLDRWLDAPPGPAAVRSGSVPGDGGPRVGFLFTGQGSAYPGMAKPLYERFLAVREVLDDCERRYADLYGGSLLAPLLTEPGGELAPVWPTDTAQPALYALQIALLRLWRQAGVEPAAVAGHSVGEYAALVAAGALAPEDGLRLTAERGRLMERHCDPGGMLAVLADHPTTLSLAAEVPGLELAVINGSRSHVLAGPSGVVDRLETLLDERGVKARRLPVAHAFHTALMDPVLGELRALAAEVTLRPVTLPFVAGLDGRTRTPGWTPDADYLVRQTREPVLFDRALGAVAVAGASALVEIGPGAALSGLARQTLPHVPAMPSLRAGAGLEPLWDAAAELYRVGAGVDWHALAEGTGGRRIPLPGYRFQHKTYWTGPAPTVLRRAHTPEEGLDMTSEAAAAEQVLRHVTEVIARTLGHEPGAVAADSLFFDLGADSLLMISVLRELEETYQVKVTMRELFEEAATPRLLSELIVERRGGGTAAEPETPAVAAVVETPAPAPAPTPVSDLPPAPAPASAAVPPQEPAVPSEFVTRAELDDISRQIKQLSQIQLQMMSQLFELTQLLTPRDAAPALNGKAAK
ncbi:beta-ketoacyl synthase N-terminal-like domain-containing protein [Streptomyces sp. NPDC005209]|uniref:type I polyketide synthase n=1 Tax=Streptomyces sp. NPDC005209 TaxID=3156715 RepID=UPI0033B61BFB